MKYPFSFRSPVLAFLMLFASLMWFAPMARAQEGAGGAGVTATVPAQAPAQAPAVAEGAKVTAKKEEETAVAVEAAAETEAAEKPKKENLNWLQKTVAKLGGIDTEQELRKDLATAQEEKGALEKRNAALQEELATARQERDKAKADFEELNGYVTQLRTAPEKVLARKVDELPAAHAEIAQIVAKQVAAELSSMGQPAKKLPGPGADAPETTLKLDQPGAKEAHRHTAMAAYWAERGLPTGAN